MSNLGQFKQKRLVKKKEVEEALYHMQQLLHVLGGDSNINHLFYIVLWLISVSVVFGT